MKTDVVVRDDATASASCRRGSTSLLPESRCEFAVLKPWSLLFFHFIMAVNLSKNGPALTAAFKEVVDEKSETNW